VQHRLIKCFSLLLYSVLILGTIWLSVRFLLPWAAPFIVAFALAALLEPVVRALVRSKWRRSLASGILTLSLLGLIVWAIVSLVSKAVSAVTGFTGQVPELMQQMSSSLNRLETMLSSFVEATPEGVSDYLQTAFSTFENTLYDLPAMLSQKALDLVAKAAQNTPGAVLFIVTAGIGTYFISASFPRTTAFVAAQLPDELKHRLEGLGQDLKNSFGGFFRAQLILMGMTFFQLLAAFTLLKVKNPAIIALISAVVDSLPVFGTGVILIPWAVYSILLGNFRRGTALIVCCGIVNLVRSCAQAKLMGDQIGLDPIVSLIAVYVGWQVWGVWGMLLFPILFVTLQQLNDKSVIKLWKNI